ncbi:MAG TPA: HAD-IA family hydrolase [Pseudoxanthomonas sp.]|nr:HAD-IA family hydrolase [Pseudoxanthomonas sp.]
MSDAGAQGWPVRTPRIRHVLFDFDGVLAHYRHELRIGHLARHSGAAHEHVRAVLFDSGLETAYDSGAISTEDYLSRLGAGLGCSIDTDTWMAARLAGSTAIDPVLDQIEAMDPALELGVLTNNGVLMAQVVPRVVARIYPRLHGRVLCSGGFQLRKPEPRIFTLALQQLGWQAAHTLFVDDIFANVQGAREAGLHAETVNSGKSLRKVLKRHLR